MREKRNAVIYARYSSHGQNDQSIDQQNKVCEKYAADNDYTIVGYYRDEAKTGTNDNRPDFQRMIYDSRSKGFQYVIVYKLDRFARNRYDSAKYKANLKKNGVKVLSAMENISDDPAGIILESVLEGMAEHYSANLAQNVRRGMDANAAQCLCTGGNRTLGYDIVNKKYVINPETAPTIQRIFEMYAKNCTPQEILHYLNSHHIKSVYGKEFKQNNIYYILTNKRYAGYYTYKGTETKGGIPAIVSEELFNQVQAKLQEKKKAPARAKALEEKYLLSTIAKCGYCGRSVIGISGTSKTGKKHFYYRCSSQNKRLKCELKSNRKFDLEDFVAQKTLELLTPERISKIAKTIVELSEKERENKSGLIALQDKLKELRTQERNLLEAIKSGKAVDILLDELDRVGNLIKEVENEIAHESTKYPVLSVAKVKLFLEQFVNGDIKEFYFREKLIEVFVKEIKVYNDKITVSYNVQDGYFFDYSTICFSSDLAGVEGFEPSQTVLETGVLPLTPYPYVRLFGGVSGTRTPDRPVMSRLL